MFIFQKSFLAAFQTAVTANLIFDLRLTLFVLLAKTIAFYNFISLGGP